MICPRCFGLGTTPSDAPAPCVACEGAGHVYCCDGLCEQPPARLDDEHEAEHA